MPYDTMLEIYIFEGPVLTDLHYFMCVIYCTLNFLTNIILPFIVLYSVLEAAVVLIMFLLIELHLLSV